MKMEPFKPDDIVKTCCKLESGLNLAIDGLRACTRGALMPPLFFTLEQMSQRSVTIKDIVAGRQKYIKMLNDEQSEMDCKNCLMVVQKRYGDLVFNRLGHVDLQHYSDCNLRCSYCAYTRNNEHYSPRYDALNVLNLFSADDVEWNAHVDFAGGEPTLLENIQEYLDYFKKRRIRVFMYTNAVNYHQAIFDGLSDGSIFWVITSLDAGTPSTYKSLRGADHFLRVMENLSKYATAGSLGNGMLAVKYIFCNSNCSNDDVSGFAYAMLALRPQQVWLTFDFAPLYLREAQHDYSLQIESYAKLYLLLKKHGLEAFHYYKEAIATVSKEGREIMDQIISAIELQSDDTVNRVSELYFRDFRTNREFSVVGPEKFTTAPFQLLHKNGSTEKLSLEGKNILLAPASPATQELLSDPDIRQACSIAFIDRNPILHGKTIEGFMIHGYHEIMGLMKVDVILVVPPEKHRIDILDAIQNNAPTGVSVLEYSKARL